MFARKPKIDFEHACRGLVKMLADTATINKAERGGYITAVEAEIMRGWIPWQQPAWSQPTVTSASANVRRDPPSLLKLWKAIKTSTSAPSSEGAEGWFRKSTAGLK